jgi:hypothetical protein
MFCTVHLHHKTSNNCFYFFIDQHNIMHRNKFVPLGKLLLSSISIQNLKRLIILFSVKYDLSVLEWRLITPNFCSLINDILGILRALDRDR